MTGPFARALSYFPQVRGPWIRGMVCNLPVIAIDLGIPILVGLAIDGLMQGTRTFGDIVPIGVLIVVLAIIKGVFKFHWRYLVTGASRDFESALRQDLFDHLVKLAPADLARVRTGDVMSRAVADIEAVRLFLGPGIMYLSTMVVIVPLALTVMARINAALMLALLVPFALLATIVWISARPTQRWSQEAQERLADIATVAQESFAGIRVVKAFATEAVSASHFRRMGEAFLDANVKLAGLRGITSASISAVKDLGALLVLALGGWAIVRGTMTVGDFWVFNEFLVKVFWPLVALGWMLGMYHRAVIAARRIEELFALTPSVADRPGARAPAPSGATPRPPRLETKGLTFGWEPGEPALRDVSIRVADGEILGITGRTGCGKSTLVQLLCRQVDPPAGTVFFDGRDVREVPLDLLRSTIGVVPQDTFLFSETLHDNIAFGRARASRDEVEDAARVARLHEDVLELDHGYEQLLGERGITLSGGQRQRAAIARMLAVDAPIMVLDDCLSAVDAVTERRILSDLRARLAGRTAVIVSHRVAALSLADRVVVMDEGRVVEEGRHEELVAAGGFYADLDERQRLEAELEAL